MPRVLPILTAAALAVTLVGCAASDPALESTPSGSSDGASFSRECATPGSASDSVKVSGELGALPTVEIDGPLEVASTERTVVIEGDGDVAEYGDTAFVDFAVYSASTGQAVTATEYTEAARAEFVVNEVAFLSGLVKTIACSPAGSRVVGVAPAAEAFGSAGQASLGIGPDETVVFVVDVVDVQAPLTPAAWTDGVPTVERDGDGVPTVTLPDTAAPAELQLAVLEEGDGETVITGDNVTVNYHGLSWEDGETFDESFTKSAATFNTTGVVKGFGAALVGQKVGSSVIVTMPPSLGYGDDPAAHALGGKTLVFLVDIVDVNAG